jgi:hypothetical protein
VEFGHAQPETGQFVEEFRLQFFALGQATPHGYAGGCVGEIVPGTGIVGGSAAVSEWDVDQAECQYFRGEDRPTGDSSPCVPLSNRILVEWPHSHWEGTVDGDEMTIIHDTWIPSWGSCSGMSWGFPWDTLVLRRR